MYLDYLKTFVILAESKNFTQAADLLYISQSSLSKRIQKIESHLGVQLFNRTTKSVELSEYGKIYLNYAKKILQLESECIDKIEHVVVHGNSLIVGSIPSISQYGITEEITNFIKKTSADVKIVTNPSGKLEDLLYNHQCDFAFIREVSENHPFKKIPYTADQMVAVLPKHHQLASETRISVTQLEHESFLLQPKGSRPYNLCVTLCERHGFVPNIIYADSQIGNILDFVSAGMGVSLLMSRLVPSDYKKVVTVPIRPKIETGIFLCYLPDAKLTDLKNQFISYIQGLNH